MGASQGNVSHSPGRTLHNPGHSVVHQLAAHLKVLAMLGYVLAVVATPRNLVWPYALHLVVLLVVIAAARVPMSYLVPRLAVETPFVLFAVLTPFVAYGPTVEVLGLTVSQPGLWAAWALLAKGTLGVLAALTLAATTREADLLDGLRRLRAPSQLVEIMGFMVRYASVIADQWRRMRIARESRGFTATSPASWRALSSSLGTLFIRSYERGERVHLAMLSRGYTGSPAVIAPVRVSRTQAVSCALLPAVAAAVTVLARMSA